MLVVWVVRRLEEEVVVVVVVDELVVSATVVFFVVSDDTLVWILGVFVTTAVELLVDFEISVLIN